MEKVEGITDTNITRPWVKRYDLYVKFYSVPNSENPAFSKAGFSHSSQDKLVPLFFVFCFGNRGTHFLRYGF